MPGTTTHYGIEYALGADDVEKFPAEVSQPGAETIDKVLFERLLTLKEHGSNFTAASGELVKCTLSIIVTLPSPAINAVIGILANGENVTVAGGLAKIYTTTTETVSISLNGYQHITLVSDGTSWFEIGGEQKHEEEYSELKFYSKAEAEAGVEASTTRPALVVLSSAEKAGFTLSIHGKEIRNVGVIETAGGGMTIELNPKQKWKIATPIFASVLLK